MIDDRCMKTRPSPSAFEKPNILTAGNKGTRGTRTGVIDYAKNIRGANRLVKCPTKLNHIRGYDQNELNLLDFVMVDQAINSHYRIR